MAIPNQISVLMINNISKLITQMVPSITQIIEKIGIQNIGQLDMKMPGVCLLADELQNILRLRNNLIDKLNSSAKKIELLSKPLGPLNTTLDVTKKSLNTAKTTLKTVEAALIIIPPSIPIPGSVITGYVKIDKLLNITLPPIVTTISNKIDYIAVSLDYANSTIFKLLSLLKIIDQYLIGCGISPSELTPTNGYINQINQQYTEVRNIPSDVEVYKGFTLEIVEEPYSPTVNRRKAVAKNIDGIVLLSTPLSFTTKPQILIEELKLIIDTNYSPPSQVNTVIEDPIPTIPPPPPLPPLPFTTIQSSISSQPTTYITQFGDTFAKIAQKYNVNVTSLQNINNNLSLKDYFSLSRTGIYKNIQIQIPGS